VAFVKVVIVFVVAVFKSLLATLWYSEMAMSCRSKDDNTIFFSNGCLQMAGVSSLFP
jgi:hypothetical protein